MKRIWFDPNIITPTDGINYYIRLTNNQYFPFGAVFDISVFSFFIHPTTEQVDIKYVLMCSEIV